MQFHPIVVPLMLSTAILVPLGMYGLMFRRVPAAVPFALAMVSCAAWAVIYALEILSVDLSVKVLWAKLRFIPIGAFPVLWFVLVLRSTGHAKWLARGRIFLLLVIPLLTIGFALAGDQNTFFRFDYRLDPAGDLPTVQYSNGPWFLVNTLYTFALMASSIIFLLGSLPHSKPLYRRQTWLLVAGLLVPTLGEVFYQAGLTPIRGVNLSPILFILSGAMIALALFRYRLLDLVPIAGSVLMQTVSDSAILLDSDDRLVDFNPRACAILGFDQRSSVGLPLHKFPQPWRALLSGPLRSATMSEVIEVPAAEGARWFELSVSDVTGETGPALGRLVLIRDVTEARQTLMALRRSEEQLAHVQKMEAVGRLAGGVAHDFNNLLMVIGGYSELVLGKLAADSPLRADVEEISRAAVRAAALTSQLLAFGRKQILQPRIISLNALVHDMEKLLKSVTGEDVEVVMSFAPDAGNIMADPGQIELVIMNLAVNSRDAMPRGGRLSLQTSSCNLADAFVREHPEVKPGRYVQLTVNDSGSGMDAGTLRHIFEPFFTTKELGKGTGLGLSTVYGIVKQSEGYIYCESQLGRGTTFTLYFPEAAGVPAPVKEKSAEAGVPSGAATVLLAEDEDAVRSFAATVLQKNGYRVIEARNGREALSALSALEKGVDLLITDVVMPQMGGRELALQAAESQPGLQVLYISGHAEDAIVNHGVLQPGVHFIKKPFASRDLLEKIRIILESP